MSKLKPYEEAIAYFEQLSQRFEDTPNETYWGKVHNKTSREMFATALDALRRTAPANEPLCEENENFIQTKYGYCFYALDSCPIIYNLYVHPQYRRQKRSKMLLRFAINQIRESGYKGEIHIQAHPREGSVELTDLTRYYQSLGLTVCEAGKPERSNEK